MRRRCFIVSALLLTIIVAFVVMLWFPPIKKITVPMSYSTITNMVAQWRPARIGERGLPIDVCAEEKSPDALYIRSIFERGDPKFGPFTVVRVSKINASNVTVELDTMQYALCGLFGRRHLFFIERQRWKEIQELVQQ